MKKIVVALAVAAAFLLGYGYQRWYALPHDHAAETKAGQGYHCPMHPSFRSDKPGKCGICGMELVPDQPSEAPKQTGRILYYRDPADPSYRSDTPGLSPATGNELEPVYESPAPGAVAISAEKQQWIGVRIGTVERAAFQRSLRAAGRVAVDETRLMRVTSRTDGWIEKVNADFVGRFVKKGEPLLTLYSPELTASQQEYLLAKKAQATLAGSTVAAVRATNDSMVDVARERLEHHWGLDAEAFAELERTGKPRRTSTLYAPRSGFIMARNAFPGSRVTTETELYSLADLSRVWIIADVFESDAAQIRLGQHATIQPSYGAGPPVQARVSYIFPSINPQTRTLQVRLEAANPNLALKPDLFVNVEFHNPGALRIAIPEDAVLDAGMTKTVFIARDGGVFEPRRVETGEHFDGNVEILSGLSAGERIAVSGAFLLDSESKLKNPSLNTNGATGHAGHASSTPAPSTRPAETHRHD